MYAHIGLGQQDCAECNRLWRVYAAATINLFQLQSKLRVVTLELRHDERLTAAVAEAEAAIKQAREAVLQHEKEHGVPLAKS